MTPSLESFPPEILFNILSYTSPFSASLLPLHPLYTTAATSKHLRAIVEEYARTLLAQHAHLTPPKAAKTNAFVSRRKWVRWIMNTCQMCGKSSHRRAILDPALTCCSTCDKKHFPKMTMTDAITNHGLAKLDLFTPNRLHPTLPPVSFGTYKCMGGDTTMLFTPSVLARKDHIHGLLGDKASDAGYLRRRVAALGRMTLHMEVEHHIVQKQGKVIWEKRDSLPGFTSDMGADVVKKKFPKSMQTKEARETYVKEELAKQWDAMGMGDMEASKEEAIVIE